MNDSDQIDLTDIVGKITDDMIKVIKGKTGGRVIEIETHKGRQSARV